MESIETLNYRLKRDFGYFQGTLMPLYRIVWSHDEMEKRRVTHSSEGFELLSPVVVEVPKYRQWADNYYILERCLELPENIPTDLVEKFSYEPIWTFRDNKGNPLPPIWSAIRIVIDTLHKHAAGIVGINGPKYKDPLVEEADKKIGMEVRRARIDKLKEELFGEESPITDALTYKQGVVVPHSESTQTGEENAGSNAESTVGKSES